jgi:iron complex outermembrane receptor protein
LNVSLEHRIWSRLSANWQLRWRDREGAYIKYEDAVSTGTLVSYSPYATLDLKLQWTDSRYKLWVEGTNLTNHTYYDLGNIPQPGIVVLAGFCVKF